MGWEVLMNDGYAHGMRFSFFCNTADKAFGSVFYLVGCDSILEFYDGWDEVVGAASDPRAMDEDTLWEKIFEMKKYFKGRDQEKYDQREGKYKDWE